MRDALALFALVLFGAVVITAAERVDAQRHEPASPDLVFAGGFSR